MEKMKQTIYAVIIFLCVIATAHAKLQEGDNLLGGTLGFWTPHSTPTFGVNYEYQITQAGGGTISLGGIFRYWSYTNDYPNGDSRKYSFSTFGVQSNYNFNQIGDGKFVPFVGLVIGYNSVNQTYTDVTHHGIYETDVSYTSGAWLWAQGGMRYFFSNNVAGAVRLNLGNNDYYTIELGVDFKF
jgi:hypothetical protein